jgi:hypothetical protein
MSERDACENPREMLSEEVATEFVSSADELERRIAVDLRDGREQAANDDAATDGGRRE